MFLQNLIKDNISTDQVIKILKISPQISPDKLCDFENIRVVIPATLTFSWGEFKDDIEIFIKDYITKDQFTMICLQNVQ